MDQDEFEECFDLKYQCANFANQRFPIKRLTVFDHFHAIEKTLKEGRGMSKLANLRTEYLCSYSRIAMFFQFFGVNIDTLTDEEISLVEPIVKQLDQDSSTSWENIIKRIQDRRNTN